LQYKNKKNYINLYYHKSDSVTDAKWQFFAILHGKDACDGIGEKLKG
jgi:hypothetical protein